MRPALLAIAIVITALACGPGQPQGSATRPGVPAAAPQADPAGQGARTASATPQVVAGLSASAQATAGDSPSGQATPAPAERSAKSTSAAAPAACAAAAAGAIGEHGLIVGVRIGAHDGFDRIVFEFAPRQVGSRDAPTYEITRASAPYRQEGSGFPIAVAGDPVLKIRLSGASSARADYSSAYTGSRDFVPGFPILRQLKDAGDFESQNTWFAGLNGAACVEVRTLTGPTRLVIDLRRP